MHEQIQQLKNESDEQGRILKEQRDMLKTVSQGVQQLQEGVSFLVDFAKNELQIFLADEKERFNKSADRSSDEAVGTFVEHTAMHIDDRIIVCGDDIIKNEKEGLSMLFGTKWDQLMPSSQTSLISAGVLLKKCSDINTPQFDYSGICICATSALEAELKRVFFSGLIGYMASNYGNLEHDNPDDIYRDWPDALLTVPYVQYKRINMYKDVIPLTKIEVRWLKTILEDDKIFYFFSDEEVSSMKRIFAQYSIGIHPFPMHTVNYFDRYKFSEKQEWKASAGLNRILEAIRDQKILEVRYSGESKKTEPYEMTPERTWSFENEKLEDLLERLQITEDTQNRLRDYFSDTTELLIEAKGCGMSDDQYCALKYALIGTTDSLKTVIKQMNLEQSAEDKLIRSLNSNNIDNVLRMAKKIMEDKLPDDFEQKLRAATQISIVKVIDEELKECQDRQKKKKLKRSLNKNNIENLLEAAREAGLSDIQIIRLQEA